MPPPHILLTLPLPLNAQCSVADSALQLCLNLFFASWLSQLATPYLSHRRRLSSSGRLCLATCRLRLSTRHRHWLCRCPLPMRRRCCCRCAGVFIFAVITRLRLLPLAIVALGIPIWIWGSPYGKNDHRFHTGIRHKWIPVTIWGSRYGNGD